MSLAQRFERRLEGMVGAAFARVFKGQVEPVEIGNALQREAAGQEGRDGQRPGAGARTATGSPSGTSDYERLAALGGPARPGRWPSWSRSTSTTTALATIGDIEVYLAHDQALHTGVFGVASRMEPQAPPRRRPMDSMSMPVVAGQPG